MPFETASTVLSRANNNMSYKKSRLDEKMLDTNKKVLSTSSAGGYGVGTFNIHSAAILQAI